MFDLEEIRTRVSLVALAEKAGAQFDHPTRLASHCPLPGHKGDRSSKAFTIYAEGRKWKCHSSCPEGSNGGDVIAFYMALNAVDFKTAVQELAELAGLSPQSQKPAAAPAPLQRPQPLPQGPGPAWRLRAGRFIAWTQEQLAGPAGLCARAYLAQERGLWPETWREFCLGYCPENLYDAPERWGLDGGRKIWLPRGIVIPGLRRGEPWYLKIRRPLPGHSLGEYIGAWTERDGAPEVKFGGPRGGESILFGIDAFRRRPVLLLTEGEWDALLAWQWGEDLCDVGTLGGARAKLDALDLVALTSYLAVIVVHDDDQAGEKGREYVARLRQVTERVRSVAPPAHDLTDFWKNNGDLRAWIAGCVADALEEALGQAATGLITPAMESWRQIALQARQEAVLRLPGTTPGQPE